MKGKCNSCGNTFTKSGMFKHLRSCVIKKSAEMVKSKSQPDQQLYYIGIQDRFLPNYWIYIQISGSLHLTHLDQFLREIWVECCGHLSEFEIGNVKYELPIFDDEEEGDNFMDFMMGMLSKKRDVREKMNVRLSDILKEKMKFVYIYDFGSSTILDCKVLQVVDGGSGNSGIELLSRNTLEDYKCLKCGKQATNICAYCYYDHLCYFCEQCSKIHHHDDDENYPGESFMVTLGSNSPRTAICGYPSSEDDLSTL